MRAQTLCVNSTAGGLWFSEQQEKQRCRLARWRPRRNRSDECQHSADLTLDDLWRNAVSAPVGRNTGRNLAIR